MWHGALFRHTQSVLGRRRPVLVLLSVSVSTGLYTSTSQHPGSESRRRVESLRRTVPPDPLLVLHRLILVLSLPTYTDTVHGTVGGSDPPFR